MPEEATQVLAQFAAALTYEQLPDRVKEHCKNLLLDALACALAGHQGEETHQVAALASSLAQSSETSVIGGDRLSLAGATLFNGYLDHRRHHVRRASLHHDPCHPGGDAAGSGDRRTRRWFRPRSAGGDCRRMRGDDPHRDRARLSGVPRPRLPRTRRARAVRRGGSRRTAARLRRRDHGEGVRPCRQPGGRHVRRVGNADGEIPSVPRRALRACWRRCSPSRNSWRHANSSPPRTAASTTPTPTAGSPNAHRRSRPALGARADRAAAVAVGLADAGHEHRAVRPHRAARDRPRRGQDGARDAGPDRFRHARQASPLQWRSSMR